MRIYIPFMIGGFVWWWLKYFIWNGSTNTAKKLGIMQINGNNFFFLSFLKKITYQFCKFKNIKDEIIHNLL